MCIALPEERFPPYHRRPPPSEPSRASSHLKGGKLSGGVRVATLAPRLVSLVRRNGAGDTRIPYPAARFRDRIERKSRNPAPLFDPTFTRAFTRERDFFNLWKMGDGESEILVSRKETCLSSHCGVPCFFEKYENIASPINSGHLPLKGLKIQQILTAPPPILSRFLGKEARVAWCVSFFPTRRKRFRKRESCADSVRKEGGGRIASGHRWNARARITTYMHTFPG